MTKDFDLVVIGGGPAGISGANTAAIFGKRVALVEKLGEIGGAGINTGTIPSKTLRERALALSGWRSRKLFGVDLSLRREATVEDFTGHKEHVVAHDRKRREGQLRTYKIETFQGVASFVDPITVRTAPDTLLRGEKILIATGSSPRKFPSGPTLSPGAGFGPLTRGNYPNQSDDGGATAWAAASPE
jgi:NAD(P) transhydrogenase